MQIRNKLDQFTKGKTAKWIKGIGITLFVVGLLNGLIITSNLISAKVGWIENWHFPRAQAFVQAPISNGGLDLNRPQEVQALINHFADIRKGDDSFKAETAKEIQAVYEKRNEDAYWDALTIIKVQYDSELSDLVKIETQNNLNTK